eukprot:1331847-Amorphochlora_amoeboformis.AAC.1
MREGHVYGHPKAFRVLLSTVLSRSNLTSLMARSTQKASIYPRMKRKVRLPLAYLEFGRVSRVA